MGGAANTLAELAAAVARIEAQGTSGREAARRMALGPAEVDRALGGGLKRGALHAVTATNAAGAAAATGFAAALAGKATAGEAAESTAGRGRAVLWIRQDMAARENGELWGPGLIAIGLDPDRLVLLHAKDLVSALKAAEAGLACQALAATVIEPFGAMARFDRVAGRRLALAAGRSGALALMLRIVPPPGLTAGLSAADTRWLVASLGSSWSAPAQGVSQEVQKEAGEEQAGEQEAWEQKAWEQEAWERPLARVELVRNRMGSLGRWPLAWGFDDGAFRLAERSRAERRLAGALDGPSRPDAGAAVAADPRARAADAFDRPDEASRSDGKSFRRAG